MSVTSEEAQPKIRKILIGLYDFYFGIYRQQSTYQNLLYTLFLFPIGIISYIYVVVGVSVSVSLMIFVVGFPLNYLFLKSLPYFLKGNLLILTKTTGMCVSITEKPMDLTASWVQNYKILLTRKRTFLSIVYMLLLFPVTLTLFVITIIFLISGLVFRIDPITGILGINLDTDLNLLDLGLPNWVYHYQSVLLSFLGFILMAIQLNLINQFVKLHAHILSRIIQQ